MINRFIPYLLGLLFIGLFFNPIKGQETISSSQLFSKVLADPQLDLYKRKMDYLQNTSHDLPILEEAAFRTETDEFRLSRQEYTARFKFNSRGERQAQKQFHQSTIIAAKGTKNNILLENLAEKYQLWTSYFFYASEKNIREQELEILEDKFKVLSILAKTTGKYDVADLIRVENNMDELENDIFELESRMRYVSELVGENMQIYSSISLDTSDFISLENLRKTLGALISPERTLESVDEKRNIHPDLNAIQEDINKTLAEIELEKAKQGKILDFVQIKYAGRDEDTPYSREWSFGLGLKIPIRNSDILDIRSLELDQLESENELKTRELEMNKRIADRNVKIQILFNQRNLLIQQLAEHKKNYSLEHYARTGTDPLVLLEIKESQLRKERAILNIEEDIYFYYLDILELTGKIVEMPFVNYLSEDLGNF